MRQLVLNLDSELFARLEREARRAGHTCEELAREAIVACADSRDPERLLKAIARAASARRGESPVAIAEEALLTDNEALALAERPRSRPRGRRG